MKAWLIRENDIEGYEVIFAETRGKAKSIALHTDTFSECDFCDLEACRAYNIDKYYTDGKRRMNWYDQQDRLAFIKEYDSYCIGDFFGGFCENCLSKDYCGRSDKYIERWQDYD